MSGWGDGLFEPHRRQIHINSPMVDTREVWRRVEMTEKLLTKIKP